MTVVFGAVDVPMFAVDEVLKDVMKTRIHQEFWESSIYQHEGHTDTNDFHVVNDSNMDENELGEVIACFNDHIQNLDLDSWMSHSKDLVVGKKDSLEVEVYYGIYNGPFNTKVHVWHVMMEA